MQFHIALEKTFNFIRSINRYAEQRAPWKLAKSQEPADRKLLETTLANMAEGLRLSAVLLAPIMPRVSEKILVLLGAEKIEKFEGNTQWSNVLDGKKLGAQEILFPRPAAE